MNDTVEPPPPLAVRRLSFASEIDLSFIFLLALPLKPPTAVCGHLCLAALVVVYKYSRAP